MEDETKCPQCKEIILKGAKKCKHCNADLRNWFARHKILTGLLLLILVGTAMGSVAGKNPKGQSAPKSSGFSSGDTKDETKPTVKPTDTPLKVSAREIGDDFESNKVAAESKWSGKLVEFKAKISNITDTGIAFQNVTSKDFSLTQISCRVKDKNQLLPLKKEQTVTVQGIVGKQVLGVIDLSECRVVQ